MEWKTLKGIATVYTKPCNCVKQNVKTQGDRVLEAILCLYVKRKYLTILYSLCFMCGPISIYCEFVNAISLMLLYSQSF